VPGTASLVGGNGVAARTTSTEGQGVGHVGKK